MSIVELRIGRFEAALLTVVFAVLICLPLCKQWLLGEPNTEAIEGRRLKTRPALFLKRGLKNYPENFEEYYNDHFGFRAELLQAGGYAGLKYANISLSPDVIIGREGWLFIRNAQSQENYHGGPVISGEDLERWKRYLEARQEWLAQRGIRYLFVVPPDKQSVYPEFLPDRFSRLHEKALVTQLEEYLLARHSSVRILSLLEPMRKAKGSERLYYCNDTHWNTLGAFLGYREIIARLCEWFPELKSKERADFKTVTEYHKGDLSRMMGMPDYSAGDEPMLVPLAGPKMSTTPFIMEGESLPAEIDFTTVASNASSSRKVVMKRDSYTVLLAPMLSANFPRITYFSIPLDDPKSENVLAEAMRREKPDVFIEEVLERFLILPPQNEKIIFGGGGDSR